jgi:hypothetical protein
MFPEWLHLAITWIGISEMTTSKKDGTKASKLLSNPKTSKTVKSVAASDLAGRRGHKPGK